MRRLLLFVLCVLLSFGAHTQEHAGPQALRGGLENPASFQRLSGIGVISGWGCEAERIDIAFNPGTDREFSVQAAYGTEREDTRGAGGDADNGFGLLFNWNILGDGLHTVEVKRNGKVWFRAQDIFVITFGKEMFTGTGESYPWYIVPDFPRLGESVIITWQPTTQNFNIIGKNPPPPDP